MNTAYKATVRAALHDRICQIICEERNKFDRLGPAKSLDDLWFKQAANRIVDLIDES